MYICVYVSAITFSCLGQRHEAEPLKFWRKQPKRVTLLRRHRVHAADRVANVLKDPHGAGYLEQHIEVDRQPPYVGSSAVADALDAIHQVNDLGQRLLSA